MCTTRCTVAGPLRSAGVGTVLDSVSSSCLRVSTAKLDTYHTGYASAHRLKAGKLALNYLCRRWPPLACTLFTIAASVLVLIPRVALET